MADGLQAQAAKLKTEATELLQLLQTYAAYQNCVEAGVGEDDSETSPLRIPQLLAVVKIGEVVVQTPLSWAKIDKKDRQELMEEVAADCFTDIVQRSEAAMANASAILTTLRAVQAKPTKP